MYVYFIQVFSELDIMRIKIGRSADPDKRMRALQIGSPVKLKMLGTIRCKSEAHSKQIEKLAHRIFGKQRRKGEWFRLSKKHLAVINDLILKAAEREQIEVPMVVVPEEKPSLENLSLYEQANRILATRPISKFKWRPN